MYYRVIGIASSLLLGAAMAVSSGCGKSNCGCKSAVAQTPREEPRQSYPSQQASLRGPAGPDGPTGATGERGARGETGEAGYAMAGPRGERGEFGPQGRSGPTGSMGASGRTERGPAGVVGPAGDQGERGARGGAGARGASEAGFAGSQGDPGAAGARGPIGDTGVRGATTVGPAGPAGRAGAEGARGEMGARGSRGATTAGVAGAEGPTGFAGTRGPSGPTGPEGPAGIVERWTLYREYWFYNDESIIQSDDSEKAEVIVSYMKQNPSLIIGIDGYLNPNGSSSRDQSLCDRRVIAVRDALVRSGLTSDRIKTGAFGESSDRRDRRVAVLFISDNVWDSGVTPHYGRVVSVGGDSLVMTDSLGENEHTCTLTRNVVVLRDGRPCRASDLKPGMRIRVTASRDEWHTASRVEALDRNRDFEDVG